ncbi:Carbohydrate sulfotransferase 11 [Bulinus truncatus]|nr:Carbohydrate sulfotransferase 11 [Bulinus truncatus]
MRIEYQIERGAIGRGWSAGSANDTYSVRRAHTAAACKSKKGVVWPPPANMVPRFKDSPLISKSAGSANDTYSVRRAHTAAACKSKKGVVWPPPANMVPRFKDSPLISKRYGLTFCPVGKVASSFFTRYMIFMESNGSLSSPYDIPIEEAGRERVSSLKSLNKTSAILSFLNTSTKLVFGRDPYSRILSAYVDKLFSPNPFYWKHWGEKSLKLDRVKRMVTRCASDVTFNQFVRLVVMDLKRTDVHLAPVSTVCNMCSVHYDVIGKLETVGKDLDFLQQTKKIPSGFQYAPGYKLAASLDAVHDSVRSAFAWKKDIKKCISLDQMGMRIWRKLQLRASWTAASSIRLELGRQRTCPQCRHLDLPDSHSGVHLDRDPAEGSRRIRCSGRLTARSTSSCFRL